MAMLVLTTSSRTHSKTAHCSSSEKENTDNNSNSAMHMRADESSSAASVSLQSFPSRSSKQQGSGCYSNNNRASSARAKQSRRSITSGSSSRPPPVPTSSRSSSSYISGSSSGSASADDSTSAAHSKQKRNNSNSGGGGVEPEVFLRNPRTGGFDYTPAQREYQNHMNHHHQNNNMRVSFRDRRTVDDDDTLNDSDIYTTFSDRPVPSSSAVVVKSQSAAWTRAAGGKSSSPKRSHNNPWVAMLSPRSKGSFQRYFQTKATKTPNAIPSHTKARYSPPEGGAGAAVTPSPHKKKGLASFGSVVQQLKCKVTGSPPRTIETKAEAGPTIIPDIPLPAAATTRKKEEDDDDQSSSAYVYYLKDEIDEMALEVQASRSRIVRSARRRRNPTRCSESVLVTPPRSAKSPRKQQRHSNSSGRSVSERSLMDNDDDDDDEESTPSFLKGPDLPLAAPTTLSPSCASESSCLDFSFSTMGNNTKANDSAWTFEAVSPVLACARDTTTTDDADSVEISGFQQDSGFDADVDKTENNDDDAATLDFSLMNPESLSLQSSGALLLTEEGLKRHNDKKLRQPTVEPLQLRQHSGPAGKLEKVVLHQKVQRLQAKELQKQADASLEEEVTLRKLRHKKQQASTSTSARHLQQKDGVACIDAAPASPPRTPPKTPTSMSPQTSLGVGASPDNNDRKETTSKTSWLKGVKRVLQPKKKKHDAEELKRVWKENERKRVELARLERKEAERTERAHIEELRQSYLEKQRQLEAAAVERPKIIIDVDDLIAANYEASGNKDGPHSYGNTTSSSSTEPSSTVDDLGSSTATTTMSSKGMGTCNMCHIRERSHIAMPCMHFSFCGHCAQGRTKCPLCSMENVRFSLVNTE